MLGLLGLPLLLAGAPGSAKAQEKIYVLNGQARQYSQDPACFQLTEAVNGQTGSVWYQNKLVLTENFDFTFELYFGTKDANGADGIGFVLQPINTGQGSQGEGMGFQGIRPSVVVEYDTWQNQPFDPAYDHIAILRDGVHQHGPASTLAGPVPASATSDNIEDGQFHSTRIVWNAFTRTLRVYFDGVLRTSYTGDVVNTVFGGNPNVFWGFTSATGGSNNVHRVCITSTEFREELTAVVDLQQVCKGDRNGQISVRGQGGQPPYLYSIDGGRTFGSQNVFANLIPGTYLVQVKDANNDLSPLYIISVRKAEQPLSLSSAQTGTGCPGTADGALRALPQGGQPPYRFSLQPEGGEQGPYQEEDTFVGLSAGSYTLRVTDSFGCSASTQGRVEALPVETKETITGSVSVCPGVQGVTYRITDAASPTGYRWFVRGGTMVAGQGSTGVTVDWGPGNAEAEVWAVGTTSLGCRTDTIRLPVRVGPLLLTPTPGGPTQLCAAEARGIHYETSFTAGSVYAWEVIGGTIVSADSKAHAVAVDWQPGTSVGKLVVTQVSTTDLARCFGQSDTLFVSLLPSPDPGGVIAGPTAVCANAQNLVYRLEGRPGSSFAWTLNGTPLPGTGSSVTISMAQAGTSTLTGTETTAAGCAGQPIQQQITVHPLPSTQTITGPAAVCPESRNGISFRLDGLPGSAYAWTVTGGTLRSGQGTGQVTVDFDLSPEKAITVQETSAAGCAGPLLSLPIRYDESSIRLFVASTDEQDERQIVLQLAMPRSAANGSALRVFRREAGQDWAKVGETANTASSYTDASANPASQPYSYKVESANACGTPLATTTHQTIWLQASGDERQETLTLRWTHYRGWDQGVKEYQVMRKIDGETAYSLFRTVPAADSALTATAARDGFRQTYRIRAIPAGSGSPALVSWSNSDVVSFENPLAFYNIFSPNGDGVNETFHIDNIRLYPGNELAVFNRWGKEVFRRRDYDNSWDGRDLAEGVYYYQLTLPDRTSRKGWVELVR